MFIDNPLFYSNEKDAIAALQDRERPLAYSFYTIEASCYLVYLRPTPEGHEHCTIELDTAMYKQNFSFSVVVDLIHKAAHPGRYYAIAGYTVALNASYEYYKALMQSNSEVAYQNAYIAFLNLRIHALRLSAQDTNESLIHDKGALSLLHEQALALKNTSFVVSAYGLALRIYINKNTAEAVSDAAIEADIFPSAQPVPLCYDETHQTIHVLFNLQGNNHRTPSITTLLDPSTILSNEHELAQAVLEASSLGSDLYKSESYIETCMQVLNHYCKGPMLGSDEEKYRFFFKMYAVFHAILINWITTYERSALDMGCEVGEITHLIYISQFSALNYLLIFGLRYLSSDHHQLSILEQIQTLLVLIDYCLHTTQWSIQVQQHTIPKVQNIPSPLIHTVANLQKASEALTYTYTVTVFDNPTTLFADGELAHSYLNQTSKPPFAFIVKDNQWTALLAHHDEQTDIIPQIQHNSSENSFSVVIRNHAAAPTTLTIHTRSIAALAKALCVHYTAIKLGLDPKKYKPCEAIAGTIKKIQAIQDQEGVPDAVINIHSVISRNSSGVDAESLVAWNSFHRAMYCKTQQTESPSTGPSATTSLAP